MITIHFTVEVLLTTQDANKLSNRNREEQIQRKVCITEEIQFKLLDSHSCVVAI